MNRTAITRILTTIAIIASVLTATAVRTEARPVPSRPVPSADVINHVELALTRS